ncbi:hypothetical protein F5Y16DRAFT_360430 [Xylariaceae sp. FL0255]|nr:hypothetical protein F5Y16DRAFT_360430 [Xylariaceae sp. FL0255]
MSGLPRSAARTLLTSTPYSQRVHHRCTSWIAFEMPNPALYAMPNSMQPKRPGTMSTTTVTATTTTTTTHTTSDTQDQTAATSVHQSTIAPPAISSSTSNSHSGMKTGPSPLSQVQKRSISNFCTLLPSRIPVHSSHQDREPPNSTITPSTTTTETESPEPAIHLPANAVSSTSASTLRSSSSTMQTHHASPFFQVQKRTISNFCSLLPSSNPYLSQRSPSSSSTTGNKKTVSAAPAMSVANGTRGTSTQYSSEDKYLPKLLLCLPDHPATWPVEEPEWPDQPRVRRFPQASYLTRDRNGLVKCGL